ncbi:Ger(x)C family spore germination protein [Bacillus sp. BRMEA1]|uniref:Ger(x)C family spore germination protein n=1 Tax=Neobacillus endophyticus TaxID=2738405 RepID=UPI00156471C1|nr:Ger(x)C family spore germination protein [Neobacillus endophyticus]NRD77742.1 Ger(x)C family spore germination protein [Neobacillus endophyticus]
MRVTKIMSILLVLFSLIPISGCWDRREIQDIGITLGIGFDKPVVKEVKEQGHKSEQGHRVSMIHQFAIPKQSAANKEGGAQKDYFNLISEGDLVFDNLQEISMRIAIPPSYEHLKVIVISEDVARTIDLNNIINFILRNTETRRSTRVVVSKGKAREVFEKQGIITNPALKLMESTDNYNKTMRMATEIKLGEISGYLSSKRSFVVQRVTTSKKEMKIHGAAVINGKSGKMIGELGEKEIEGLNWLKGDKGRRGIVEGVDPKSKGKLVYELRKMKSKIQPKVTGSKISFTIEIETEGKLREDWVNPGNAFKTDFIKRAELATGIAIKKTAERTLAKTQKEFKEDVLGLDKRLSIDYPHVWKKVKGGWSERFSEIPVNIKVRVKIRDFGTKGTKKA